jgi:hypothetical protein
MFIYLSGQEIQICMQLIYLALLISMGLQRSYAQFGFPMR